MLFICEARFCEVIALLASSDCCSKNISAQMFSFFCSEKEKVRIEGGINAEGKSGRNKARKNGNEYHLDSTSLPFLGISCD